APSGVVPSDNRIYWANAGNSTIGRANIDGSAPSQSFISGGDDPFGLAANSPFLYWTNFTNGDFLAGTVGRADLNGLGVNQSFITGADAPDSVAIDES